MLKNMGLAATAALVLGGAVVGSVLYEQYALLVAVTAGAILLAGTRHKGGTVSFCCSHFILCPPSAACLSPASLG
jgi:hypothetical protein